METLEGSIEHLERSLLWDGTFLGVYGVNSIKAKETTPNKLTFATIHTKAFKIRCILKRSKDPGMVCLLDELKECFGIKKMGTHHIQLGNILYVMIRCKTSFFPLKDSFKADESFKIEMRKLICYRMLLRIPHTSNRSFLVMNHETGYTPRSFVEIGVCMSVSPKPPTRKFLERWFGDKDISDEIISIFPKRVYEEWSEFLLGFRSVLCDRICQVDKEYVWLTSFIIEKMNGLC